MNSLVGKWRSLLLFLLIPGLAAVAPLLVYPAITSQYGTSGFAAIAIGQSVGATTAVICELGWSVIGPQTVAKAGRPKIALIYHSSLVSKSFALLLGLPTCAMIAFSVAADHKFAAALTAIALGATALSPMWLLTGLNRPGLILWFEVAPRVLLNVVAAFAIGSGAPLEWFALVNVVGITVALIAARVFVGRQAERARLGIRATFSLILQHLPLAAGRSASVVYTSLLTTITAVLAPGSVALFAAADRVLRMGLGVLAGVPARMQSWIGQSSGHQLRVRSKQVILLNTMLGIAAGFCFSVAVQPAAHLLFAGAIRIPVSTAILGGILAFIICTSRGIGLLLVAYERPNVIALASGIAAGIGLIVAATVIPLWGANGAFVAALSAEVLGLLVQSVALVRVMPADRS